MRKNKDLLYLLNQLPEYKIYSLKYFKVDKITDDSRKVADGSIFVAIKGLSVDSNKFISEVIKKGAKLIVSENSPNKDINLNTTGYIMVKDPRLTLAYLSSAWYGNPSKNLKIIGVTGTDGKTTTSNIIYWILNVAGKKVGLISTVSAKIDGKDYDTGFHVTNPEPLELQNFLEKMVIKKCNYAILEVTSHGLDQERVGGLDFEIGVLTNITHEHLDYHKTFSNYLAAKQKLFERSKTSILNANDKSSKKIMNKIKNNSEVILYSFNNLPTNIQMAIKERFLESYNWENASAAVTVALKLKISENKIIKAIKTFPTVEGRMQEIPNKLQIRTIVDFAHTPNALENVLKTLKNQLANDAKLITVFGCAGQRDIEKRPMMGRISKTLADISIYTAEDPRNEDLDSIMEQMMMGANKVKNENKIKIIPDRKKAIEYAIQIAKKRDIVVVCGKGHEKSMNYNGTELTWSDIDCVKETVEKEFFLHKT